MDSSSVQTLSPSRTHIPGGMYPSKTITVSLTILSSAQRFKIILRSAGNIAFQMNTDFDKDTVVRNSLINGSWGSEEISLLEPMPFFRGHDFSVKITCEKTDFKVEVNGQHLFDFNYRLMDLRSINLLEVAGDVKVNYVQN